MTRRGWSGEACMLAAGAKGCDADILPTLCRDLKNEKKNAPILFLRHGLPEYLPDFVRRIGFAAVVNGQAYRIV